MKTSETPKKWSYGPVEPTPKGLKRLSPGFQQNKRFALTAASGYQINFASIVAQK